LDSAVNCFKKTCDMFHDIESGDILTIKQLNEKEMTEKKFDPDPNGTGEFVESRAIPFTEAIKLRNDATPYLLCSYID